MSVKPQVKNWWRFLPGVVFITITILLWTGLHRDNISASYAAEKRSFPSYCLQDLTKNEQINSSQFKGKPYVVHIWATWCGTCLEEYPMWVSLQKKHKFTLVGVAYRDSPEKVKMILKKKGNPFTYMLSDASGELGLDLGIPGVPATYLVDANGKILFSHFGDMTAKQFEKSILPRLK